MGIFPVLYCAVLCCAVLCSSLFGVSLGESLIYGHCRLKAQFTSSTTLAPALSLTCAPTVESCGNRATRFLTGVLCMVPGTVLFLICLFFCSFLCFSCSHIACFHQYRAAWKHCSYDGDYRGVGFVPHLCDGDPRQYAYLPFDLF